MRFDWDPAKSASNRRKHGLGFEEAQTLFTSGVQYLEISEDDYPMEEPRFIAVGPVARGIIVVVWTEQAEDTIRIISARPGSTREVEMYLRFTEGRE